MNTHQLTSTLIVCALTLAAPASGQGKADMDRMAGLVELHNKWRAEFQGSLTPLLWDQDLADGAQVWAEHLDDTDQMVHDIPNLGDTFGSTLFLGENIATGDSPEDAGRLWYEEKAFFLQVVARGKKCSPDSIDTEDYSQCGHYANIVGSHFDRIGCGMAGRYLVCRYGQFTGKPKVNRDKGDVDYQVGKSYQFDGRCVTLTRYDEEDGMITVEWVQGGSSGSFSGPPAWVDNQLGAECQP